MQIENICSFVGHHCETTVIGTLLNQIGIKLSEPMIFGLGEGLAFGYFNFKMMPHPFIGGRTRQGEITRILCKNLNLHLQIKETKSKKTAWKNVEVELKSGNPVGLQLDCYHLEYFSHKIHFAGHFVAMYGYDDKNAYLIDTESQGTKVKTSLKSLELARSQKGPMAAKNKSYTISIKKKMIEPRKAIRGAIKRNARAFLNPPIKNLGFKGIAKTAEEMSKWIKNSKTWQKDTQLIGTIMERGGTGGSLFRNLYRDFIAESSELLNDKLIAKVEPLYVEIAILWKEVADLFMEAGKKDSLQDIDKACKTLLELHTLEKKASEELLNI